MVTTKRASSPTIRRWRDYENRFIFSSRGTLRIVAKRIVTKCFVAKRFVRCNLYFRYLKLVYAIDVGLQSGSHYVGI